MRPLSASLSAPFRTRRRRVAAVSVLLVAAAAVAAVLTLATRPDGATGAADRPTTARQPADARDATPTPPTAPAAVDASDRLLPGERLRGGESIGTSTGSHRLAMQADGDAVLLAGTAVVWNTGTAGNPGAVLQMREEGELTLTSADGDELWSNGASSPGARLVVKPDGRLYGIATAGHAVWSTPPPSFLATAAPYVNPDSPAAVGARQARVEGREGDALLLDKAAAQGSARWLSTADTIESVADRVRAYAQAAEAAGQTPVFVTYAIPDRDCGSMSAGGLSVADYRTWSEAVARGLQGTRSVVIVEPDSLLHVYRCGDSDERFALLKDASASYAAAGAEVYLDAGTSNTFGTGAKPLDDIAARLEAAGVDDVAGFATNVSNFQTTADEREYGNRLSARLGGARYLIDTSRNGNGGLRGESGALWCNPPGRALGEPPAATADGPHVANLWVKTVGLSDGTCNGGPQAGTYWEAYLLELAANARW